MRVLTLLSRSPVLVWDPSAYNASLPSWDSNPDYPFFETFFSKRLMRPKEQLHLLRPEGLWSIWNWLQAHNKYPLMPNPPSSGFLGLVLALRHCRKTKVIKRAVLSVLMQDVAGHQHFKGMQHFLPPETKLQNTKRINWSLNFCR